MKVLKKKIILADEIDRCDMNLLKGGIQARANKNEAIGCKCTGSSNGYFFCNDNTNRGEPCTCAGKGDNSNLASHCNCEGNNENTNEQNYCQCR